MGQQSNKIIKRRRRADYLKRKKEQLKLGGLLPKVKVKKSDSPKATDKSEEKATKKAPTKKAAAKKAPAKKAAKKAPAKKAATKTAEKTVNETDETHND